MSFLSCLKQGSSLSFHVFVIKTKGGKAYKAHCNNSTEVHSFPHMLLPCGIAGSQVNGSWADQHVDGRGMDGEGCAWGIRDISAKRMQLGLGLGRSSKEHDAGLRHPHLPSSDPNLGATIIVPSPLKWSSHRSDTEAIYLHIVTYPIPPAPIRTSLEFFGLELKGKALSFTYRTDWKDFFHLG